MFSVFTFPKVYNQIIIIIFHKENVHDRQFEIGPIVDRF